MFSLHNSKLKMTPLSSTAYASTEKKFDKEAFTDAVNDWAGNWAEDVECWIGQDVTKTYLELLPMFRQLVVNVLYCVLNYKKSWSVPLDADSVIEDCVAVCFQKAKRFDPYRGRAFNYFTTIILSHMRQAYMTHKRKERKQNEELLVR